MADVARSVLFVMKQEDAGLTGVITTTPGDLGGTTRFGLTAKYHPQLVEQQFYDCAVPGARLPAEQVPNVPADRAQVMAEAAYEQQYTRPLYLAEIQCQALATAMLSFAVVEGQRLAVQMLQAALERMGRTQVAEDGALGPQTVDAANECDPKALLNAWCAQELDYFAAIVQKNPSQQKFLEGWDNRVEAIEAML